MRVGSAIVGTPQRPIPGIGSLPGSRVMPGFSTSDTAGARKRPWIGMSVLVVTEITKLTIAPQP